MIEVSADDERNLHLATRLEEAAHGDFITMTIFAIGEQHPVIGFKDPELLAHRRRCQTNLLAGNTPPGVLRHLHVDVLDAIGPRNVVQGDDLAYGLNRNAVAWTLRNRSAAWMMFASLILPLDSIFRFYLLDQARKLSKGFAHWTFCAGAAWCRISSGGLAQPSSPPGTPDGARISAR